MTTSRLVNDEVFVVLRGRRERATAVTKAATFGTIWKRFNASQPRVPAGNAKGGQFTRAGGGHAITYDAKAKQWGGAGVPAEALARAKALGVPPGWRDVRLNPDPTGALQAVGTDTKGRVIGIYSAEHVERQAAAKFARVRAFNKVVPKIMGATLTDLDGPNGGEAAAVRLIGLTGMRIGSDTDTGAEKQAYGASTLQGRHVTVKGTTITAKFVGKKGVDQHITVDDAPLAAFIQKRKATIKPSEGLFGTSDERVRDWFHAASGGGFKVKDLRTWNANAIAAREVQAMPRPTTKAAWTKARAAVGDAVSALLGNTRTVALASYIDPAIFAPWGIP